MMKKIIAGVAAAALAVSAMATAAFAATETKTIEKEIYNGTSATMTTASYTATATVKLPAALTAVTGSKITSSVKATDTLGAGNEATLTKVTILGTEADATGKVTASVLGTTANTFVKGTFTEVTVVYTFNNKSDATAELTADQLTAVNTALKAATITLDGTWKAGDEAIAADWTSAAIGDTTAVNAFVKANAENPVNNVAFKFKAAEKAALLEAGAAKVVLTIVSENNYANGVEQTATIGAATVKVKPAADTKTLTFETDLTALYSEEYGEWEDLSVSAPACLTAKLVISYEAEVEETEDTSADETDVTEDTSADDTAAPEDTSADDTSADDTAAPEDTSADDTTAEGDTGADAGEGEDGENGKGDNTETGVVLAVVPAIVAGAALVVSRKRK